MFAYSGWTIKKWNRLVRNNQMSVFKKSRDHNILITRLFQQSQVIISDYVHTILSHYITCHSPHFIPRAMPSPRATACTCVRLRATTHPSPPIIRLTLSCVRFRFHDGVPYYKTTALLDSKVYSALYRIFLFLLVQYVVPNVRAEHPQLEGGTLSEESWHPLPTWDLPHRHQPPSDEPIGIPRYLQSSILHLKRTDLNLCAHTRRSLRSLAGSGSLLRDALGSDCGEPRSSSRRLDWTRRVSHTLVTRPVTWQRWSSWLSRCVSSVIRSRPWHMSSGPCRSPSSPLISIHAWISSGATWRMYRTF